MIRLFVTDQMETGREVGLSEGQAHYLVDVMRLTGGEEVLAFNGRDGEWRSRLSRAARRAWVLVPEALSRQQAAGPDLDLLVALVRRPRLETIVEKAAELGVRRVRLLTTERTGPGRANMGRLEAIATEAAEQTGRLDVPKILPAARLKEILSAWSGERRLMFCDESGAAQRALEALGSAQGGSWGILIGPEGGFSPAERARIRAVPGVAPVGLGPRILRADTAAVAALALWQAALGDWRGA
ncbi:MAG TPA: 16S rRNA (uracil(1498)-N(3))-methyltransferase [Caulobacteraceae bacterium]